MNDRAEAWPAHLAHPTSFSSFGGMLCWFLPSLPFALSPTLHHPANQPTNHPRQGVAKLECRGVEVTAWRPHPDTVFKVAAESGKEFDADLSEDFTDFDEDGGVPVSVLDVETKVEKGK